MPKHAGARARRLPAGVIRGTIVDDDDGGEVPAAFIDDGRDGGGLVEARNDDGALGSPVHEELRLRPVDREAPCRGKRNWAAGAVLNCAGRAGAVYSAGE